MTDNLKSVPPNTARLIEGFRDTGYTFNAAVADIIDNSIAANATKVAVTVAWSSDHRPMVWIADNGDGMDLAGLENAMRYGSDERGDPNSLSKFGLGLKTASTSFCRRLTVISRSQDNQAVAAAWDLDVVVKMNDWLLELGEAHPSDVDTLEEAMEVFAPDSPSTQPGTLVTWEKVDRLLKTKQGHDAKNRPLMMSRLRDSLNLHLRTVFQRYLDLNDVRAVNVEIYLDDQLLETWDPFCAESGGDMVKEERWEFESPTGEKSQAHLRAFILPRPEEFTTEEDRREARISNDRQGIYLYREDRLIEGPDWLGTGSADTHLNNLRVELSFPAPMDELFGVGIKKSGVHLDSGFLNELQKILQPIRREADQRARKGNAKKLASSTASASRPTETTISRTLASLTVPSVKGDANGSMVMTNNTGEVTLTDASGKTTGTVRILMNPDGDPVSVVRRDSLEDGALWMASLGSNRIQVALNAGHDWYRKAYVPNASNSPLVQAIEFLFYALAQAEMNNTNSERDEIFEEFRMEVSRNLRRLVKHLPDPDEEE